MRSASGPSTKPRARVYDGAGAALFVRAQHLLLHRRRRRSHKVRVQRRRVRRRRVSQVKHKRIAVREREPRRLQIAGDGAADCARHSQRALSAVGVDPHRFVAQAQRPIQQRRAQRRLACVHRAEHEHARTHRRQPRRKRRIGVRQQSVAAKRFEVELRSLRQFVSDGAEQRMDPQVLLSWPKRARRRRGAGAAESDARNVRALECGSPSRNRCPLRRASPCMACAW